MTKYRCPSLGDCERANSGEIFDREAGQDLKCPDCQALLEVHPLHGGGSGGSSTHGKRTRVLVAAVAGVVLVAGAIATMLRKPEPESAPVAAAPESAQVAAAPAVASASAPMAPVAQNPSTIAPVVAEVEHQKALSQVRLELGDTRGAEAQSAKAASNEMVKLGIAQLGQGKLEEAEKAFTSALQVDPGQSLAHYNLAVLRLRQGRSDDALKQFEASFANGFSYFDKLDEDRDLDAIRQDKRFSELVARYRPASTAK